MQSSQTDPWLTKTNELAFNQIQSGVNQTGGLPAYLNPNPYANPGQDELALYSQLGSMNNQPLTNAPEQAGLDAMKAASDPNLALSKASQLYSQYGAPIVGNDATVAGQGRGGAVGEQLATGFSNMALPIISQANQNAMNYGSQSLNYGNTLEGREVGRIQNAISAAQAPRLAASAEYMRPLQTIASLIGGLPLGGGEVTGYQTGNSNYTQNASAASVIVPLLQSLMKMVGSFGGAMA